MYSYELCNESQRTILYITRYGHLCYMLAGWLHRVLETGVPTWRMLVEGLKDLRVGARPEWKNMVLISMIIVISFLSES